MVLRDREVGGATLRWVNSEQITAWRRRKIANLHNTEGRRVIVEDSYSTDKSIPVTDVDAVGNPVIEKPAKLAPRSGREVSEMFTQVLVGQWLWLKKHDPPAFRRKLADLRGLSPQAYAHLTDDQLEAALVDVCRRVLVEGMVQKVYEGQGRGGGYRETML